MGEALSWALFATAALLFVFAIRFTFRGNRSASGNTKRSLGCGFGLVATVVWTLALSELIGDLWVAARLAVAVMLLLPVVEAIARPEGARTMRAAVALVLAALLAGPVIGGAWDELRRPESESTWEDLEQRIAEQERSLTRVEEHSEQLREEREELVDDIRDAGHANFDEAVGDTATLHLLEELADLDRLLEQNAARAEQLRSGIPEAQSMLRRLRRRLDAQETVGDAATREEVESMLAEMEREPVAGPATVETLVERERLRDLFENGL